jgi:membrane dipeptidase
MMVDLSHVSEDAAKQALSCTVAPVIFSHSNVKAIFDCPRNVSDSVLDLVPANGGIVMVTFVPEHLSSRRSEATMDMLLDHLFYIAERIGWDHVGLGSDFDGRSGGDLFRVFANIFTGIASVIPGLEDCSTFPNLLKAILDRGATESQLAQVAGENIIRVWQGVASTAERLQAEGMAPVEETWEKRKWWRYDGFYQMPDPDPEDKLGLDWYGCKPPEEGLYHSKEVR